MSLNFALVISGDATGAKNAAQQTTAAVRETGAAAEATAAAIKAANDQSVASAQRVIQALTGEAAAQKQVWQATQAMIARGTPTDDATYRQRGADIDAYGAALDRLRARYNPLFAAEQAHLRSLAEVDHALKVGAISEAEHADAVRNAAAAYELQVAGLDRVAGAALAAKLQLEEYGRQAVAARQQQAADQAQAQVNQLLGVRDPSAFAGSARASAEAFLAFPDAKEGAKNVALASHEMANLTFQMNDVAMMLASGQSPFILMMQQGSQISQILGQRGIGQILPAIGAALKSLISPTTLLLAGITAAGYAAYGAYRLIRPEVKSLDDALKDHEDVLKRISDAYGLIEQKAKSAFSYDSRNSVQLSAAASENELRLILANSAQSNLGSILANRGGGGSGNQFGPAQVVRGEFSAFSDAIDHLRKTAKDGQPDIAGFRKMVADRWALEPNNLALQATAGKLLKLTEDSKTASAALMQLEDAKRRFDAAVGPGGIPLRRGALSTEDTGAYSQYLAAQKIEIERQQQAFEAQLQTLYARSPSEIGAAARATASSQYNDNEDPAARTRRINQDGQMAQLQAQYQLDEAQKERKRSLDALLGSQQLDLALIGKTVGETERMRLQFQLTQELREEAARNNTPIDQDELNRIIAKAKAYGEYADQIARANLARDLAFEREQLFRSDDDAEIAQRLRGAGLPVDLNSELAGQMRVLQLLERQKQAWEDIRDVGRDAIDQLLDVTSWDDFEEAGKKVLNNLLNEMLKLSVGNPLKNAIYGDNLPTLQSMGGFGGVLGALFGAPFGGGDQQVSSMTVSAGNVVVTGSIGAGGGLGGLVGNVQRLLTGANDNPAGGIGDLLGRARSAIASIESAGSGGYSALGPKLDNGDQALGAYQVMASNLTSWTKEALGKVLSPSQFLASPESQDQVFNHFFGKSLSKYGNMQDAASVWFTGRPVAGAGNATDALGTTTPAYLEKFNAALGKLDATTTGATRSLGQFGNGLGQLGNALNQFPAAPGGGGLGSLGSLFNLNSSFAGSNAFNWLSANPGGFIGLYDVGGWTGPGGKFEPRGIVHADEYVFSKEATRAIGVGNLDKLHSAAQRGFASGGFAGSRQIGNADAFGGNAGAGRTVIEIRLADGLKGEILQQSGEQTVQIIEMNERNREELYRAGGQR